MRQRVLLCVVVAAGILLAGCATERPLTKKLQPLIENAASILVLPQNNLDVTVPSTNTGNNGLLVMLVAAGVDAARQAEAEKAAKPITDALQDYDFRTVMRTALQAELQKVTTIQLSDLKMEKVDSDSQRRIDVDTAEENAVLFIIMRYRLETGNLIVTANAQMFPRAQKLKPYRADPQATDPTSSGSLIYQRLFSVTTQAVTPGNVAAELNQAAESIAQQISADLNHPL